MRVCESVLYAGHMYSFVFKQEKIVNVVSEAISSNDGTAPTRTYRRHTIENGVVQKYVQRYLSAGIPSN